MFRSILHGLSDLVYPPHCLICKKHIPRSPNHIRRILCPPCQEMILPNIPPFCPKCSRHLRGRVRKPRCLCCEQNHPRFDFAWGACQYSENLRKLVHQFKYGQKTGLQNYFARLMVRFLKTYRLDVQQFDTIVPIPLFPTRLRERGYNQSLLLAQKISAEFNIALCGNQLIRIRHTKPQVELKQKERWTNIEGAFRIKDSRGLSGKNVLLVDDLLTTGATSSQAAETLKASGAKTVGVLTLGITV